MKVLFIACYSPLINNSASIETLQYLNNLAKEKDNEVHLLTVNFPKWSIYYDEYIFGMLDKRVKLHVISGGKLFEKIMPKKSNTTLGNATDVKSSTKSYINKILKTGKKIIAVPDMYFSWSKKASEYGIKLMEKERFDVIFSMHEPPSSHICALNIKKKFKHIPWVTYWSDPWLKDSTREHIGSFRRNYEGSLERGVVELSDRFIFVTKANRDDYVKTYNIPIEKTFILTRGYDKESYDEILRDVKPDKLKTDKINFVYAGEIFSKLRDVNPFIDAVLKIQRENRDLFDKMNILFFGNVDNEEVKARLQSVENIKVFPRIPYREALAYILNSEILLIFGNKNSKQIPAKIYDYFGAKGRIFIILGDNNDPIKDVANNDKCILVDNEINKIQEAIYKAIDDIELEVNHPPIESYEWGNISKRLNYILRGE